MVGAGMAVIGSLAVIASGGPFTRLGLAVVVPAPLLFCQDVMRFARFAQGRPRAAAMSDGLWAVLMAVGFGLLLAASSVTATHAVLVWSVSGAIAGGIVLRNDGVALRPSAVTPWVRAHHRSSVRFAGEFGAMYGASQSVLAVVAATSGLRDTAGYRGAQLLYSPLQVLTTALRLAITPVLVRERARAGARATVSACLILAMVCTFLSTGWTVAMLLLPDRIGTLAVGASWRAARPVIAPLGLNNAAAGIAVGALVLLRIVGAVNRSAVTRISTAVLVLALGSIGAVVGGARDAGLGVALGSTVGAAVMWIQATAAVRADRIDP